MINLWLSKRRFRIVFWLFGCVPLPEVFFHLKELSLIIVRKQIWVHYIVLSSKVVLLCVFVYILSEERQKCLGPSSETQGNSASGQGKCLWPTHRWQDYCELAFRDFCKLESDTSLPYPGDRKPQSTGRLCSQLPPNISSLRKPRPNSPRFVQIQSPLLESFLPLPPPAASFAVLSHPLQALALW